MKYSTRLSDAVHILTYIYLRENMPSSSAEIALSIQTNPAYIRQIMAKLKAAGILKSSQGVAKPSLAHAPEEITLLHLYRAIEGDRPLLHLDTHTNPECGVGVNIQLALGDCYAKVQSRAEACMNEITLADVIRGYEERVSPVG